MLKTYSVKASEIKRDWHLIDASDMVLGKLATQAAVLLMGKHKPMFSRHLDTGDYVVVINARKIRVTGNKTKQKFYYRHSGYPGGFRSTSLEEMLESHPARVIEHAVTGMLPRNRLGAQMIKKLKVYAGDTHPHQAQLRTVPDKAEQ
ncbi:MAG: 50S ribosomal protein L13 [Dehalococcoidales bacterium]|nr:50S ribosomal protein L13 [Dehalococcoidales bacterium]